MLRFIVVVRERASSFGVQQPITILASILYVDQFLTSQDQLVEEVHLVLELAESLTDSVGSQQTMKDQLVLQGLDFIKFSLPVDLELLLPIDCLNL